MNQEQIDEIAELSGYDEEVVRAYLELGITGSDDTKKIADEITECYQGSYADDEKFAQQLADDLGDIDFKNQPWPQYCIDWEYAAREIMMDYSEQGGHYFRNV